MEFMASAAGALLALSFAVCSLSVAADSGDLAELPVVGSWPYGTASAVAVADGRMYVGAAGGIVVFDLSEDELKELVRFPTPGHVGRVVVSDGGLVVANGSRGLRVYDISDLSSIREIAAWEGAHTVPDVVLKDAYAYVAAGKAGILAIDLNTMKEVASWEPAEGSAKAVRLVEDTLYVLLDGTTRNVAVLDMSDAPALSYVTSLECRGIVFDLASAPPRAHVLHNVIERQPTRPFPTDTYLTELDVTDPRSPKVIRTLGPEPHLGELIALGGEYAYLSSRITGLNVVDLSLDGLEAVGRMRVGSGTGPLLLMDSRLYLSVPAKDPKGVWILDVSEPTRPKRVANAPLPHQAEGVFVSGDHAYIADGHDGLYIIDVSDPRHPQEAGHLEEPRMGLAEDLWVSGTEVYMADGTGLAIIDASDPAHPVMDTYIDDRPKTMGHWVEGCMRSGDYLYVAAASELRVLNVADPSNVSEVATVAMPRAREVWVDGDYLYVVDVKHALRILDISKPDAPVEVSVVETVGEPYDVVVKDGYAYLTDSGSRGGKPGLGLVIIDVSVPEEAKIISNLYGPMVGKATKVQGLDIQGDTVYMGTVYEDGVWEIDVSDPHHPTKIGHRDTPGAALNVKVRGNLIYVADYGHGLVILGTRSHAGAP